MTEPNIPAPRDDHGFSHDDDQSSSKPVGGSPTIVSARARARRTVFAGYTAGELILGAAILIALVWAMWVTRILTAEKPQHIVKADLSRIVGEYVQAQARSATPPDQVQAQMRLFMASLDTELQRRGVNGQVVLVGEAVLSKSVPDITADVAKAVYASGVRTPQPASQGQMAAMMRGRVPIASVGGPVVASVETAQVQMVPPVSPIGAGPAPLVAPDAAPVDPAVTGASVSTFGGPGGQ
jgi:hypothetical protein